MGGIDREVFKQVGKTANKLTQDRIQLRSYDSSTHPVWINKSQILLPVAITGKHRDAQLSLSLAVTAICEAKMDAVLCTMLCVVPLPACLCCESAGEQ